MSQMLSPRDHNQSIQLSGRPASPIDNKQPTAERKFSDPSSCSPKGERYPIPSFFEYRVKAKEYDPL